MCRAALSTVTNIAEGFGSGAKPEFRRFLRYAIRSTSEVQACLYVALDQGVMARADFDALYESAERVKSLCSALVRRLSARPPADGSGRVAEAQPPMYGATIRQCAPTSTGQRVSTSTRQHANTPAPCRAGT
jgi:four helix bundle protein